MALSSYQGMLLFSPGHSSPGVPVAVLSKIPFDQLKRANDPMFSLNFVWNFSLSGKDVSILRHHPCFVPTIERVLHIENVPVDLTLLSYSPKTAEPVKHGGDVVGIFHDDSMMAGSLEVHTESIKLKGDDQGVDLFVWIIELANNLSASTRLVRASDV
jgi:hypothetical protein